MSELTTKRKGSDEFFYADGDGRGDSELHEELFEDGAEEVQSRLAYEVALADGMDPELAESLYG